MGCEKGRLLIAFPPTDGFKTDLMKKSGTVIYFDHSFFFFYLTSSFLNVSSLVNVCIKNNYTWNKRGNSLQLIAALWILNVRSLLIKAFIWLRECYSPPPLTSGHKLPGSCKDLVVSPCAEQNPACGRLVVLRLCLQVPRQWSGCSCQPTLASPAPCAGGLSSAQLRPRRAAATCPASISCLNSSAALKDRLHQ